jgi:glycosyltransferase involved in cell wall biosynthesis
MFALMARHPGVVVLHDFFLGGALVHAQMSGAAPHAWLDALFASHGYLAVQASEAAAAGGQGQVHKDWPGSLPVVEGATRTIVHSQHARQLAADWYGPGATERIDVIPHPRTPPETQDRAAARAALGIAPDCFLVCSFGFVAPHKLTHELLQAWTDSSLHRERDCALVLVGANHDSPYGVEVEALIRRAGPNANIRIAGWTDDARYRQYLQAADVGVQLRTNAQGESSGAVLDCMNYGLATIVNANGSMAEFPDDAVWRLPDAFAVAELTAALEQLRRDPVRRQVLGRNAVALLDASFRPARCSRQYLDTLARARLETAAQHAAWRAALAQAAPQDEAALQRLAATLADAEAASRPGTRRQLLVDVSDCVRPDAAFDPLTAAQLRELLAQQSAGLRVEPVYLDATEDVPRYRQARNAVGRLLGLGWPVQDEPVLDVHAGDIYYAPDAAAPALTAAAQAGLLAAWRARGVTVNLLVRAPGDADIARSIGADRLLCASDAIERALQQEA